MGDSMATTRLGWQRVIWDELGKWIGTFLTYVDRLKGVYFAQDNKQDCKERKKWCIIM